MGCGRTHEVENGLRRSTRSRVKDDMTCKVVRRELISAYDQMGSVSMFFFRVIVCYFAPLSLECLQRPQLSEPD